MDELRNFGGLSFVGGIFSALLGYAPGVWIGFGLAVLFLLLDAQVAVVGSAGSPKRQSG